MNEQQCLAKMVAPGTKRAGKWRGGVIQVWVTRACDKACFACTQGSNLVPSKDRVNDFITVDNFELALKSLEGYWGVVGMFGGNACMHPEFVGLCELMRKYVPFEQRGLWSNNLLTEAKGKAARETFNPAVSNLNVHLDRKAWDGFKRWWPESMPFGLDQDSRHSPPFVAMRDVVRKPCPNCNNESGYRVHCQTCEGKGSAGMVPDDERIWELISGCDINQHWSAMVGQFRGEARAWFCEIAGAQAMLHQDEPDYPDTGLPLDVVYSASSREAIRSNDCDSYVSRKLTEETNFMLRWWEVGMSMFKGQVRKHCFECGVPLRGRGELSQDPVGVEQASKAHQAVYLPKKAGREVQVVQDRLQLGMPLKVSTKYLQNAKE